MRLLDILIAALSLTIISPILLVVTVILRCTGEGEIIYFQKRVGYRREIFHIWKFATMLKASPSMGAGTLTMANDPRVLPFGKFLRKSKINELPQLINVLKGDMALVGPRPLVPEGEGIYEDSVSEKIRSVRPGLTGLGSLALRDEESYYAHRTDAAEYYINVIQPYKAALELFYIENKCLSLDLRILFYTAISIVYPSFDLSSTFKNLPPKPDFDQ